MKKIQVAAAIIKKDENIFATQRGYGEFKDGWEFPGGKVEPGETPRSALIREIREELDVEIKIGELAEKRRAGLGRMAAGRQGTHRKTDTLSLKN